MSIICTNCKAPISEDFIFCCNCGAKLDQNNVKENDKALGFCNARMGFNKGELHIYRNRLEFICKNGIEKMYYCNLKTVKKSFGSIDLKTIYGKYETLSVQDRMDELVKFLNEQIIYSKENSQNIEVNKDTTIKIDESNIYEKIRKHLKEKDGKVHIVMINSQIDFSREEFECSSKYTNEIDRVLSSMQDEGYEIIDVKYDIRKDSDGLSFYDYYRTLIMYR